MPPKHACAIALLLLMFSASLGLAQPIGENLSPQYAEAPRPRCDAYTMKNRISLTALEKTCYYRDRLFSPSAISGAALFAGVAQATNSPSEWPQGAKGFEWRFGTRYVQGMAKSTGVYLAGLALHEDPRAVRPECSRTHDARGLVTEPATPRGFWRRVGGAVAVNFWSKNDACKARPAFAATTGALSSGFVGMAWTPDSSNTISKAFVRSGTALGGSIGNSIFSEFQGDITHGVSKIFGHKPSGGY